MSFRFVILPVLLFVLLLAGCSSSTEPEDETITYSLNVSSSPSNGGSINPSSGSYNEGSSVSLQATAAAGFEFVNWSGGVAGTSNPISVTMNSNKTIVANFQALDLDGDGVSDDIDACPGTPSGQAVDGTGCVSPVFLADNGVTVTCTPESRVGDSGEVNGKTYTIVDETTLREMVINNQDVTNVCTCKVTNMSRLFENYEDFNEDISSWDTGSVTDISYMFKRTAFNQDISHWDVSQVRNMLNLFESSDFNQDISSWTVSNVTNMGGMFRDTPFNQDISSWNVSNVTSMWSMFELTPFNQNINNWNVSSVTRMPYMFSNSPFNQPLDNWNVSNVVFMFYMFQNTPFNQSLESWNVTSVTNMDGMFRGSSFNQPLNNWNVSSVTRMSYMFQNTPFNQPLDNWNTSNVVNMSSLFRESMFNQSIANWNISKVQDMGYMFYFNESFNQDLSSWDVSNVTACVNFSNNTPQWTLPQPNFTNCTP